MALNFTPKAVTGGHSTPPVPIDQVSEEVKGEVEEAIGFFVANPEGMALTVEFPSAADKQKWVGQAQAYSVNRPAAKGEPFVLRVSPGRGTENGGDTGKLQFRMYPKAQQDKQAAERKAIRDAAKAAQAAQAAQEAAAPAETAPAAKPGGKK